MNKITVFYNCKKWWNFDEKIDGLWNVKVECVSGVCFSKNSMLDYEKLMKNPDEEFS